MGIVMRAFLRQVGGREVDGDALGREGKAHGGQRGAYPLLAFAHRLVGQPDDVEVGEAGRETALHLDSARFQPEIGHRPDQCDQVYSPLLPCGMTIQSYLVETY